MKCRGVGTFSFWSRGVRVQPISFQIVVDQVFSSEGISLKSLLGHILVCFFVCLELCFEARGDVHGEFIQHFLLFVLVQSSVS